MFMYHIRPNKHREPLKKNWAIEKWGVCSYQHTPKKESVVVSIHQKGMCSYKCTPKSDSLHNKITI